MASRPFKEQQHEMQVECSELSQKCAELNQRPQKYQNKIICNCVKTSVSRQKLTASP